MSSFIKKFKDKKIVIRVLAIFALIFGISVLSDILQIKSDHGINQNRGLYFQSEDSIDAVFLGTSHIHCNVNTALLWEEYGIAAYDYSGAGSHMDDLLLFEGILQVSGSKGCGAGSVCACTV